CGRCGGVMLQPSPASWQLAQARSLLPRLAKNGFERLIELLLNVRSTPLGSANGCRLERCTAAKTVIVDPSTARPNMIRRFLLRMSEELLIVETYVQVQPTTASERGRRSGEGEQFNIFRNFSQMRVEL